MNEKLCRLAGVDPYTKYLIDKIDSIDDKLETEKHPAQKLALKELKKQYLIARQVYYTYKDI